MIKEKLEIEHEYKFYPEDHDRPTVLDGCSFKIENGNLDRIRLKHILKPSQKNCFYFDQTLAGINQEFVLAKQVDRTLAFKDGKENCYEPD